jgi:hypothetical protein
VFSTIGTGNANYNNSLIGGLQGNNAAINQQYTNRWDQFMYQDAVAHGLYSTPSTGGGMGGMGSLLGAGIGAVGTIGAAAIGAGGGAAPVPVYFSAG